MFEALQNLAAIGYDIFWSIQAAGSDILWDKPLDTPILLAGQSFGIGIWVFAVTQILTKSSQPEEGPNESYIVDPKSEFPRDAWSVFAYAGVFFLASFILTILARPEPSCKFGCIDPDITIAQQFASLIFLIAVTTLIYGVFTLVRAVSRSQMYSTPTPEFFGGEE